MKIETRRLTLTPGSFNREARTVDAVFATADPILTAIDGEMAMEALSMDPLSIRQARMLGGLPLLNAHKMEEMEDQIGKAINVRVENGKLVGTLFFSRRSGVADVLNDVEDGIYDAVSLRFRVFAYAITRNQNTADLYEATDWEPLEVSMVPVAADPGTKTRSCEMRSPGENAEQTAERMTVPDPKNENEERAMPAGNENEVKGLTQSDFDRLITQARGLGLGLDQVQAVMADAKEQKRDLASCMEALNALHVRKLADEAKAKVEQPPMPAQAARTEGGTDEREKDATAVMEYLHYRSSAKPEDLTEGAKKFLGNTMVDICRHILKTNGVNPEGRDRAETVRLAMGGALRKRDVGGLHTTSDFPELLGALTQRSLLSAYAATPDDYSQFVTPIVFSDPRAKSFVRVGGLGTLRTVGEGQEYKRVTFGENKEEVEIMKRGEIFALSYEAMLRDDLSAFTRLPAQFGMMSKLTESAVVYAVITANPVMSDGFALFSAQHANIGTPDSPDVSGITDARTLMRRQTDPSSGKRLGLKPFLVLSPYKFENGLSQIMADATLKPATLAEVIPGYIRDMKYVISDVLDENSTQKWYAVADPARIEGIVVGRLEGNRPFEIEQKVGWEVDGIEWKIRHWFGAGVVDHRGLYYNAGE